MWSGLFDVRAVMPECQSSTALIASFAARAAPMQPRSKPMKYMMLIYADPANEPVWGTPAFDDWVRGYGSLNAKLAADGIQFSGSGLQGVDTATSVRLRGGKVETMDGPFAETKERLGGYYVIDVPDLDAALRYAALVPSAAFGTVEVRPVVANTVV
jgi:hypothetical protein